LAADVFSSGAMFTGLIEQTARVTSFVANDRGAQLQLQIPAIAEQMSDGDSLAVNGCCLTVTSRIDDELRFDLLAETLRRTNLGTVRAGSIVNVERALAATARLGGHFVQGHIDCTVRVLSFDERGADHRLEVELPREFAHYVACKGSVACNGVSLTVAEVLPDSLVVWIIPHTKQHTNFEHLRAGDLLNVEFDLLAKYVERMLTRDATHT
jgi:riboflavin synthase